VHFDAVLVVSFGGPEGPDEVMPFLENVLRGRPVPPERKAEVAAHYHELGGVSPINGQNRELVTRLRRGLAGRGSPVPVYWGNRNWHPFLRDTLATMRSDGIRRAAAFVTSAYSSFSGCRQYVQDIEAARAGVPGAPEIVKLRAFYDHPGFVAPLADGLRDARAIAGPDAAVLMSAHSIPTAQAARCAYESQLRETARLVDHLAGEEVGGSSLVFQSRSGSPAQPWLGPDVNDAIAASSAPAVIVVPIGFVSDHMEVVYDLDRRAAGVAASRSIRFFRSSTPGDDPRFVDMICDLVQEGTPCPAVTGCCRQPAR
jgi:protoporphyrin/coproporphyrin ferrochelatase